MVMALVYHDQLLALRLQLGLTLVLAITGASPIDNVAHALNRRFRKCVPIVHQIPAIIVAVGMRGRFLGFYGYHLDQRDGFWNWNNAPLQSIVPNNSIKLTVNGVKENFSTKYPTFIQPNQARLSHTDPAQSAISPASSPPSIASGRPASVCRASVRGCARARPVRSTPGGFEPGTDSQAT